MSISYDRGLYFYWQDDDVDATIATVVVLLLTAGIGVPILTQRRSGVITPLHNDVPLIDDGAVASFALFSRRR